MEMFIAGRWADRSNTIDVEDPYDGSVIGTVPSADVEDVELAIGSAVEGAAIAGRMWSAAPPHRQISRR